jgi:hypothetical protein
MHGIFVGGKGRKYVIADSALKPVQVHTGALWLDADEHHRSFAPRTDGPLQCDWWNGGRRPLRLGHDASLRIGGSATLSVTGNAWIRSGDRPNMRRGDLKRESIRAPAPHRDRNRRRLASHARWRLGR